MGVLPHMGVLPRPTLLLRPSRSNDEGECEYIIPSHMQLPHTHSHIFFVVYFMSPPSRSPAYVFSHKTKHGSVLNVSQCMEENFLDGGTLTVARAGLQIQKDQLKLHGRFTFPGRHVYTVGSHCGIPAECTFYILHDRFTFLGRHVYTVGSHCGIPAECTFYILHDRFSFLGRHVYTVGSLCGIPAECTFYILHDRFTFPGRHVYTVGSHCGIPAKYRICDALRSTVLQLSFYFGGLAR